mmetsp:Transcript_2819/g.6744  ORF Transcript_2819/g.6744 Transcript_2819/m.6744 type:complete len:226 (+) Transcript_2819:1558-2235(+)
MPFGGSCGLDSLTCGALLLSRKASCWEVSRLDPRHSSKPGSRRSSPRWMRSCASSGTCPRSSTSYGVLIPSWCSKPVQPSIPPWFVSLGMHFSGPLMLSGSLAGRYLPWSLPLSNVSFLMQRAATASPPKQAWPYRPTTLLQPTSCSGQPRSPGCGIRISFILESRAFFGTRMLRISPSIPCSEHSRILENWIARRSPTPSPCRPSSASMEARPSSPHSGRSQRI